MRDSLKSKKNVFSWLSVLLVVFTFISTSVSADDAVLKNVPSNCLFCVRVNNFQNALGQIDQFLMSSGGGMMGSATMMAQMGLAQVLGDPQMVGVNMSGDFGIFGVSQEPDDLFVAFLLPVTNYEQLISGKSNYEASDENKITRINVPNMSGKASSMLVGQLGNYAVATKERNYEKLAAMIKAGSGTVGLITTLEASEAERAVGEPVWAYLNMAQVSKVFGPVIKEGMEQAKGGMPPGMGNIQGIMDEYAKLIDMLLNEVAFISVSAKAGPDALRINKKVATVPGTELAGILTAGNSADKKNELLGYLDDGAVINVAAKNHEGLLKKMNEIGMNFFESFMGGGDIPEEAKDKMETIMRDWLKAMGQDIAFSWLPPQGGSIFNFTYVVDVADKEAFERIIEEGMSIYDDAGIWDMYEQMGIRAGYEVERGVDTYKGVAIDAAKFSMEMTDANAPEAQMINQMYQGGFIYRWAMVNDTWVCAIGDDADSKVRELIDSALDESVKPMGTEMKTAVGLIPNAEIADFVGTLNYIRLLQMVTKMVPFFPLPVMDIPTNNNLVFAGHIGSGQLEVDVVMPKEHMQELMMIQQRMQQQMMQQMQQQQMMEQPQTQP